MAARYKVLGTDTKATSEGSEGLVVPAWDQEEMMIVALKRQDRKSDEAVRELMFFNATPRHPHVVSIIDAFVDEEQLVIVFEYMAASLMHIWDSAQGVLDYDQCRIYGRQVVKGLRHLHREGLAHRDLTLTKVLVDSRSNSVKVADLGLAVCSRDFVLSRPVAPLNFRAPEALIQSDAKESFTLKLKDPQTSLDMWSLVVILVALWCGSMLLAKKTNIGGIARNRGHRGAASDLGASLRFRGRPGGVAWHCGVAEVEGVFGQVGVRPRCGHA